MFWGGWDVRIQSIFELKFMKTRACNRNLFFGASDHRNKQKVIPKWCQQAPKNQSKIDGSQHWDVQRYS